MYQQSTLIGQCQGNRVYIIDEWYARIWPARIEINISSLPTENNNWNEKDSQHIVGNGIYSVMVLCVSE